ncbi:MAG: SusC/RagA family TonB-linked outer membrane protein, partial [Bacteroidales bacterium]|nr:SusC/RagA family TonB-linked outer membrane protein [Bacteroidales bacterium]
MACFNRQNAVRRLLSLLLLLGTIQLAAFAGSFQQINVSGKVIDASGAGLSGVNVVEKGTTNGKITDGDGNFTISVTSGRSVLNFSFIGYVTVEVTVGTQTTINVTLQEQVSVLDEIVVVGYSTQQRKSLTGAVSTVDATSLAESAASNPVQRLQGKVAGVTVLNQHTPGEGSNLRIRGMTTINDANPLFVVDGIPGGTYAPNDVESITILKDAAAQSIYGARAANGVVLVTTKSGKKNQKLNVTVNIRQGITQNATQYDLLNTQEWGESIWLEQKNLYDKNYRAWVAAGDPTKPQPQLNYSHSQFGTGSTPVIPDYIFPTKTAEGSPLVDPALYDNKLAVVDGDDTYLITKSSQGTNWMEEAQRNAQLKDYTIDVTGGSQNTTYAFLLGYTRDEGVFKYTGFDRYSFRANIASSPAKWLDLGSNIAGNYTDDFGYQGNDNSESSIVSWTYRLPTMVPLYDISGTTFGGSRPSGMGNGQNAVFLLTNNQWDFTRRINLSGNAYMRLNLFKGFSLQTRIGVNQYQYNSQDVNFVEVAAAERGTYDYFAKGAGWGLNWTWTNTAEYSLVTGQHNFKAIAGTEAFSNQDESIGLNRSEYPIQDLTYMNINTGLRSINNSGGGVGQYSLFSIFGRVNYTYADKYLV